MENTSVNPKGKKEEYLNIEDAIADFPGGIVYFQFDEKMTLEYFTDGLLNVLGVSREDFVVLYGNSFRSVISKEDFHSVYEAITESISERKGNIIECRLRMPDGTKKWISLQVRIKGYNASDLRIVGNIVDIDMYRKEMMLADQEKERYKQILNMNTNIYFEYDVTKDSIKFNNTDDILKLSGQVIPDFRNRVISTTKVHKEDKSELLNLSNYVEGKSIDFRFISVDKTSVWCCVRAVAVLDSQKNIKEIIGCIDNIDKQKKEQCQKEKRQQQDSLTQLYNRTYTQREIINFLAKEGKNSNHAFMIVDIDNFKDVNKKLGNLFGDAVLINISDNLKKIFYKSDIVGRVGGDEFLIFIKNTNNVRMLIDKTEDIREIVRNTYVGEDNDNSISCSIGITLYPDDGTTFEELFRNADMALYKAKFLGKDRYEFYNKEFLKDMDNGGKFYNDYKIDSSTRKGLNSFDREITTFAFDIMSRTKDVNSAINLILDKIGRQFDATYVNIYEINKEEGRINVTYHWAKDGIRRGEQEEESFSIPFTDTYKEKFDETGMYCVNDTATLIDSDMDNVIKLHDIKSFAQSLIFENESVEGFVNIADSKKSRKWSHYEKDSLLTVTKVIASYLLKMRASQKMEKKLESLKNYDTLTGLSTLTNFKVNARRIMTENPDKKYAVVNTDFKKFKYINDTIGYDLGDEVLKDFAAFITEPNRKNVCNCRVTSDNFLMLFEYTDDEDIINKVLKASEEFSIREREKHLNILLVLSSGASKVDNAFDDIMVPIDNANIARKQAKLSSKTSCIFFGKELREKIQTEFEITNTMETALAHNEFKVFLQPKVCLSDGKLVGAEALIRWIKLDGSIMPPDKFIPLFEKNGFVVNLDFFVYEEVCKMFREWLDEGINVVPISVNVSRVHLYDINFVDAFTKLIDSYNISHELIELELTESIFLDNTEVALSTMKKFRNYGFKVSIDDFGAGYSSLNLLKDMTSDVLKLDKEFFGRGELQKEEEIIVSSIVNMAKQLNMKVLSEGVETVAQSKFLKEIACDMAQGYLFAKPMPKESFELIMANKLQFNV